MSIFIKGIDLPNDRFITLKVYSGGQVEALKANGQYDNSYKAIPISSPHGRLIIKTEEGEEIEIN